MENLAQRQLSSALELFTAKKYDEAIAVFKRAIGLAPLTSTATNAYDYMARAYLSKDDAKSAIAAYRESLRSNPTNADTHVALGQIYIIQGELDKARESYTQAVKLDPSGANLYSLGQTYLEMEQYGEAERQFNLVKDKEPGKPNGDYGLGLTYARQGRTTDAISSFERAISLQKDFWYAHVELGYILADSGERDKASEIVATLQPKASDLAQTLGNYIFEKTPAEMVALYSTSTFQHKLGPSTQVSSLGSYLASADGQQTFSMEFQFNKQMDKQSVENVLNWSIARSVDTGRGDAYNFGLPLAATEISLPRYPLLVIYSEDNLTAKVLFNVRQNDTGDGTLDPSHIKFSFSGKDVVGLAMNPKADEYSGFSGFA